MEMTLPKPGIAHTVALPVHEPMEQHACGFTAQAFSSLCMCFFFPSCLPYQLKRHPPTGGYNLYYFHRSLMGPQANESVPLGLCSLNCVPCQRSSKNPFLPFLPHGCEEHRHSEHSEQPLSTTSLASNANYISMLTVETPKYSYTIGPLLQGKVSNSA